MTERQVEDADGKILDPDRVRINFDDDVTFTATKWELLEASLVSVPADPNAAVRSLAPPRRRYGRKLVPAAIAARMRMRLRMVLSGVSFR